MTAPAPPLTAFAVLGRLILEALSELRSAGSRRRERATAGTSNSRHEPRRTSTPCWNTGTPPSAGDPGGAARHQGRTGVRAVRGDRSRRRDSRSSARDEGLTRRSP